MLDPRSFPPKAIYTSDLPFGLKQLLKASEPQAWIQM
jgi:hypothetical protein